MAKMIPSYISSEVTSIGERQIFDYLESDPATKDWIVLHSLNLSRHAKRLYGEIDFVVMVPGLGIFCLEIKSGGVVREDGIWKYINRFGDVTESTKGPFKQAREGMFGLKEAIARKFGSTHRLAKLLYGYGVMFPHVIFQSPDPEIENWQIYDRNSRKYPISEYIKLLSTHFIKGVEHYAWFDRKKSMPDQNDIKLLLSYLRGNFEKLVAPKNFLYDIEEQLDKYTKEQYECLDQLEYNKRCLFRGAAGTGKTMIAIECARKAAFKNKKVLFLCYNSLLSHWLSKQFTEDFYTNGSFVGSFHGFLSKICHKENLSASEKNDDYFNIDLPLLALDQIDSGRIEPFDVLIIDEGQDLIREEFLDVLNGLLKGGLSGGNWHVFCDFERQAIYSPLSSDSMLKLLEARTSFTQFKLNVNCRNTKPIGEEISLICDLEKTTYLPNNLDGLPVEYYFYDNENDELEKFKNILAKLKKQKIANNRITLLSPVKYEHSVISKLDRHLFAIKFLNKDYLNYGNFTELTFSTIQGFKGLENSYIIMTDIEKLEEKEFNKLLYVGMSRAKAGLYVMMNQNIESTFNTMIGNSMKKRII